MIKAIIFDLWETIATKHMKFSEEIKKQFSLQDSPDFLEKYEKAIQLREWPNMTEMTKNLLKVFDLPQTEENIRAFFGIFEKGMKQTELLLGMKDLLEQLSKKYKLGLLSNSANFQEGLLEKMDIKKYFDEVIYSWQIGSIKPHRKNFEAVCEKLGVTFDETIFVDDSTKNIKAAESYGIKAMRFQSADQLKKELAEQHII